MQHDLAGTSRRISSRPIGCARGSCCIVVAQPIQFELVHDSCAGRICRFEFLESARRIKQLDTVDSVRQSKKLRATG